MTVSIEPMETPAIRRDSPALRDGIRFGSSPRTPPGRHPMTATADRVDKGSTAFNPRRRERRFGLGEMLTNLSRSIGDRSDISLVRGAFEQLLQRMLPVQSVRLRDGNSRWLGSRGPVTVVESVAIDVPGVGAGGVLEAAFDSGAPLGEWDFQLLGDAAHVGALVLE